MDTADISKSRMTVHIHTEKKKICLVEEKQGSRNPWKPLILNEAVGTRFLG